MSDYGRDVGEAADKAFSSPTSLAAQRLGRRTLSNDTADSGGKSVSSSRSRRTPSLITTQDEAALFDQMNQAMSVQVRNKKNKLTDVATSPSKFQSFSGASGNPMRTNNNQDFPGSPHSNGSIFSSEHDPEENYFRSGGTLSIPSPGQVDEKEFHWNKNYPHRTDDLDMPSLEEKKSATGDDDERKPAAILVTVGNSTGTNVKKEPVAWVQKTVETTTKDSNLKESETQTKRLVDAEKSAQNSEKSLSQQVFVETVNGSEDSDEVMAFRRTKSDAGTVEGHSTEGTNLNTKPDDVLSWAKTTPSDLYSEAPSEPPMTKVDPVQSTTTMEENVKEDSGALESQTLPGHPDKPFPPSNDSNTGNDVVCQETSPSPSPSKPLNDQFPSPAEERLSLKESDGGIVNATDPCGMATETLESIGSMIGTKSAADEEKPRVALCSPIPDPDLLISFSGMSMEKEVDLQTDDEAFESIARSIIQFLESRLDEAQATITINPSDREKARKLLGKGLRKKFFDALRYRLSLCPAKPNDYLEFCILKCQELGLDVEGEKNPILAALSITDQPLSFEVLNILEDKDISRFTVQEQSVEEILVQPAVTEHSPKTEPGSHHSEPKLGRSSFSALDTEAAESSPGAHVDQTVPVMAKTVLVNDAPAVDMRMEPVAETQASPLAPQSLTSAESADKAPSSTASSNPFEAFTSMASQFQQSFLSSTDPETGDRPRSVSSNRRDSPPADEKESDGVSAFAPPSHSSRTDTAVTPDVDPISSSRMYPPAQSGTQPPPYYAPRGPPTLISHQSEPLSAISGLDSSVSAPTVDSRGTTPLMMRLQVEHHEAVRLAESSDISETKAFWRNRANELESKLEAHQQALNASPPMRHPQMPIQHPVEQRSSQYTNNYYAMHQENAATAQSHVESLEYESRMVDVIAPADLPGGYHFEAEIEGQRFLATVPPGGVQQGETFTCYMRELNSVAIDIPVGYWKDNMCHMCVHGLCHPTLWHSLFCPLIMLGQVTHRLQLDFLGRPKYPGTEQRYSNRFMMLLVTLTWLSLNLLLLYAANYKWMRAIEFTASDWTAFAIVNVFMYAFIVFVAQSTRSSIREKFMIQEERCYDLEDVMCASTCLPCTVAQMARHTANYNDYEAVCCSKSGLPDGVKVNHTVHMKEDGQAFA